MRNSYQNLLYLLCVVMAKLTLCYILIRVIFLHILTLASSGYHDLFYFDIAATPECHAADTEHNVPTCHRIQMKSRPVVVLSIVLEPNT